MIIFSLKLLSNSSVSNTFYWPDGSTVNPSYLNTGTDDYDACNSNSTNRCLYLNKYGYIDNYPCTCYRSFMCQF